jgi:hypothetical protein
MGEIDVNIVEQAIGVDVLGGVTASAVTPPGGADTNVQYNDAGAFAGEASLIWNKVSKILTIIGSFTSRYITAGTVALPGSIEINGKGYSVPVVVPFANPLNCDCSLSNNHRATITGSTVVNLTNLTAGMSGVISLLNDGVGGYTVTLGAAFTKKINGSNDYVATASKYNLINWYYQGTQCFYTICNEA